MKRVLALLLAALLLVPAALAENLSYDFGSFSLVVPEDVTVEEYDTSITVVREQTRVVVQLIPQETAEQEQSTARDLIGIYHQDVTDIEDLPLTGAISGATGLIENRFGEGIDEVPVLILAGQELLILSGYDMDGNTQAVRTLLTELLDGVTLNGRAIHEPAMKK